MKNTLRFIVLPLFLLLGFGATAQSEFQADATGTLKYTSPEALTITAVYPSPATERVMLEFTTTRVGEELVLRVRNADGKVVMRRNLMAASDCNLVILPVAELPTGEYLIQLDNGKRLRSARWQKM